VLFRQLREHYQQRDRLRLIVDYRRKFLDPLVRGGEEEAKVGGALRTGESASGQAGEENQRVVW